MLAQRDTLLQLAAQRRERRRRLAVLLLWREETPRARHAQEALCQQAQVQSVEHMRERVSLIDTRQWSRFGQQAVGAA